MSRNLCNCPNCQTDDCPAGIEFSKALRDLKRAEETEPAFRFVLERIASFKSGGYIAPGSPEEDRHTMIHLARGAIDENKLHPEVGSSSDKLMGLIRTLKYSLEGCHNCPYEALGKCEGEPPAGEECLKRKEIKKVVKAIEDRI